MTLAEDLAGYATSKRFTDLDAGTVSQLKMRLVDAVGCALGAFEEKPVGIARAAATEAGEGSEATLLGTRTKASMEWATFVNGLMIRYFDYNDTYLSKEPAHPSDNLSPCLAVAQGVQATGKEFLTAAAVAYEVQCRLCDAADIRHRGWDHVNYGLVSSALGASLLMGLDGKRATHAVNLALSGHVAMRQVRAGELSMWKGASFADAARSAVFAARLARLGMTGPAPIFEGEMGFFNQVSGKFRLDVGGFGGERGKFKVNDTYIKYWPAEYHAQTAIWAAIEVRKKVHDPSEVESVLVETHEAGYSILGKDREKWRPATKETADHSLPFIVGMALLRGTVDNDTYSAKNLADRKVLAFLDRVRVREDPSLTALYPARGMANRLTATLRGGAKVAAEVTVPLGHPLNPLSRKGIEEKFLRLSKEVLGPDGAREALDALWKVEEEKDMGRIMQLLASRRPR